ncbi:MAG: TetR/AcrR family transcriptional regulator [Flavisolibacter sp.]|nr:TetR/AcrR family transcriptional regulator [Flavisolibacter sp.]
MANKKSTTINLSTEEKIQEAARKVFTRKGYAATRTRDIAEESGINLALLNYYFRSKEKLFHIIMSEKVQNLFGTMLAIVNNPETSLKEKIELIVEHYFALLEENPDLPLFVLSEIRNHPSFFEEKFHLSRVLRNSEFIKQIAQERPDLNPLENALNLLGMIIFPFIARPILFGNEPQQQKAFNKILQERKQLIPRWIEACLKCS